MTYSIVGGEETCLTFKRIRGVELASCNKATSALTPSMFDIEGMARLRKWARVRGWNPRVLVGPVWKLTLGPVRFPRVETSRDHFKRRNTVISATSGVPIPPFYLIPYSHHTRCLPTLFPDNSWQVLSLTGLWHLSEPFFMLAKPHTSPQWVFSLYKNFRKNLGLT